MTRVAVIGGGPAGATAARELRRRGHEVVLVESRPHPEKPCGGGLTQPAWRRVEPYVGEIPKRLIRAAVFRDPRGRSSTVPLRAPLVIVSRRELDARLCAAARAAGVRFCEDRVVAIEPAQGATSPADGAPSGGHGFTVQTEHDRFHADFIVGADGAKSMVRKTLVDLGRCRHEAPLAQFSVSLTTYPTRAMPDRIDLRFFRDLNGYAWLFPRTDHVSAGICAPVGESPAALRERLGAYVAEVLGEPAEPATVGALIPSFDATMFSRFPVAGDGWALAGDAAGAVDPLTREGIRFAIRTGELIGATDAPANPGRYRRAYEREICTELRAAARLSRWFFRNRFLERFTVCMDRSPHAARVFADIVEGTQSYRTLLLRCLMLSPLIALECWRGARKVS